MRILKAAACLAAAVCLAACAGAPARAPDQSAFTWKLEILGAQRCEGLHAVQQTTQYDGTVSETEYEKQPQEGQVFLLVNLRVHKLIAGGPAVCRSDTALQAPDGSRYARLADNFLQDYGYSRMPAADLQLKENEGWVCFEVPAQLQNGSWALVNTSSEGENSVPFLAEE